MIKSETRDRLSELPDSLIFHIFWFLPITDVVGTTILSKQWKHLWKTAPFLNFDVSWTSRFAKYFSLYGFRLGSLSEFGNIINQAMLSWKGFNILKLKIQYEGELTRCLVSDIKSLVRFAKEKEAKELHLDLLNSYCGDLYEFECLYSCSSLEVLSITGCRLDIAGKENVQWDQLKSLTIQGFCIGQNAIEKVLCGSPKLEVFILTLVEGQEDLCIRSTSLKKLSICHNNLWGPELKIRAPNLEVLELLGTRYCRISMEVPSLTDVTLGFFGLEKSRWGLEPKWLLQEKLQQILPTIQHVERVTLSDRCVEVLEAMNKKCLLSPLSKVKFLKLIGSFSNHQEIALHEIFPNLESVVIEAKDVREQRWRALEPIEIFKDIIY